MLDIHSIGNQNDIDPSLASVFHFRYLGRQHPVFQRRRRARRVPHDGESGRSGRHDRPTPFRDLHIAGIALGLVYLLATMLLGKSGVPRPARIALVFLMIALTAVSQFRVIAKMQMLRLESGSIFATPPDSPIRVAFGRLHTFSVWIEGVVVIAGVAALYLTARAAKPVPAAAGAAD